MTANCMFEVEVNAEGSAKSCTTIYTVIAQDAGAAAKRAMAMFRADGFKGRHFAANVKLLGVEGGR